MDAEAFWFTPWMWLTSGLLLVCLEMFLPTQLLLWSGVAALGIGVLLFPFPYLDPLTQMALFAILSCVLVVYSRKLLKFASTDTDKPTLNRRAESLIGQRYPLVEASVHGRGRIKTGDTLWRTLGPDLPAGTLVEVTGCDGSTLYIQEVEKNS